jgi:TrmH family RNA methyltransferase
MLSKNDIKLYKSLKQKKFRNEHQLYIVEGKKSISDFIESKQEYVRILTSNSQFHTRYNNAELVPQKDIIQISALKNPTDAICIATIPKGKEINFEALKNELILILDELQDPGNLGTIIRIADWFGIKHIVCSENTVESYNPKTLQATMGSHTRVSLHYTDLGFFLQEYKAKTKLPVYATTLEGENIYKATISSNGAIVVGNEGNGISETISALTTNKLTIPRIGKAESLNAGIATSIICSEFRRQFY